MKKIAIPTFGLISMFLLCSCGSEAQRIDPSGDRGLVTTGDINTRDWQDISARCVNSLVASGALNRADGRKSIVMVSTVKNSTDKAVNTGLLTNKIRQALLASGKALTTTAVGAKGAEDKATRQVRELENDDIFNTKTVAKRGTVIAPDMSLSGEIIKTETTSGRKLEANYMFHVVMTDLASGLAVWEDTFEITKQETKSIF